MQAFKTLEDIFKADPVYDQIIYTGKSGAIKKLEIKAIYRSVSKLKLNNNVPEEIRGYFNSIKNLLLYSYFHYGLVPIGAFMATTAVEMTLRTIYPWNKRNKGKDSRSFKKLFRKAIQENRIVENEFLWLPEARRKNRQIWDEINRETGHKLIDKEEPYPDVLERSLVNLRNYFAHPAEYQKIISFEMAMTIVRPCTDVINQLFKDRN